MNTRSELIQKVEQLIRQQSVGRQTLSVSGAGCQLDINVQQIQQLGCSLWQLDVHSATIGRLDPQQASSMGQRIADRVRYLLEPLQVHEVDAELGAVQLRSSPPQREERTVRYFEVTLQAGSGLRLVRYEKKPGQPRQQVIAVVTVEALGMLCQDIDDLLASAD